MFDRAATDLARVPRRTWVELLAWCGAGALLAPVSVLAHELAHFAAGGLAGFPDLELHADAVTSSASTSDFPASQLGLMSLAGPLCTLVVAGAACAAAIRWPGRLLITLALVNLVRPIATGVRYGVGLITGVDAAQAPPIALPPVSSIRSPHTSGPAFPGTLSGQSKLTSGPAAPRIPGDEPILPNGLNNLSDETVAAFHFGLPGWVFVVTGFIIASGLAWLLLAKTRGAWSILSMLIMSAGAVAGFFAYVHLVFPWFAC